MEQLVDLARANPFPAVIFGILLVTAVWAWRVEHRL